ncbi:hypothetical protein [Polluticaenibacter yanchengensis]|uniref:Uncharacterized protein n=1 Tax=Polluticaenibacter yanchengensis TaxID=3014562 RepID=A0ABT4UHG7_9BACT|nr:hypothetical protein [Chitinophagaceae bacterium LY-5]
MPEKKISANSFDNLKDESRIYLIVGSMSEMHLYVCSGCGNIALQEKF